MNKKIIGIAGLFLVLLVGLYFLLEPKAKKNLKIDVSAVDKNVTIAHFDDAFFTTDTIHFNQELKRLQKSYAPFFNAGEDESFWLNQRKQKNQINLYKDWKQQKPNYTQFDSELTDAFKHLYFYYPEFPQITAFTYISNLDFDYPVLLADKFLFFAVDMYLGKNHPAYQQESNYLNYYRQAEFLVPDGMEQFALNLAAKDLDDNTLLNDMIWWGKVAYFKNAMQPEANDTIVARMSSNHLNFCRQNEINIWTFFIDNKLLFETNDQLKRKFISPAPFSKFGMPFDNETPGMIGRWLGLRIVQSYMQNNPEITLQNLMANKDAKLIFKNSKYKP